MNLFVTDPDPRVSARSLSNRHVVKMTLETAQILSTVLRERGLDEPFLYRMTHRHHPVVRWAGESRSNFRWALAHGLALAAEYTRRYGKRHKTQDILESIVGLEFVVPEGPLSPFAQAMPVEFQGEDPHAAYRRYLAAKYAEWEGKGRPARFER